MFKTDIVLVELSTTLQNFVRELGYLVRGYAKTYPEDTNPWWDTTEMTEEMNYLVKELGLLAPEGFFFGAHPRQPQCFGYWKIGEKPCGKSQTVATFPP